jgi:signal transduction histidine kinase
MDHPTEKRSDAEFQLPGLVRGLRWLDARSPAGISIISAILIVSIGAIGHITGPQLSSSLLYLIPVLLVTRVAGFRAGLVAAVSSALMWLAADLNTGVPFTHPVTPYWNAAMRLGTFLIAVSLVSAMHSLNAHLEERVKERTAALEAQIEEKRQLEKTILEISDMERSRIGQDLHDGLSQQLVSAAFTANMLHERVSKDLPSATQEVEKIADMIDDAITQARNLARGLYPVRLETEGLEMALRELASTLSRRFHIACTVSCTSPVTQYHSSDIHLYRIAQEAVVNAAKHSGAKQIIISLRNEPSCEELAIEDDGGGIGSSPNNPDGMGLRIMEYRARMIGADFKVASSNTGGTRVSCLIQGIERKS